MRERLRRALVLLCCALAGAAASAAPVTDDRGVALELARAPQRIVAVLPSLAETVCELGACDRLVGVDDYADWPAAVRGLPRVGGVQPDIERIVALRPDLVLLPATSPALPRLQALHVPVFGVELKTFADLHRTLLHVGALLQVAGAPLLWEHIERSIAGAARRLPAGLRGTTVYFEVSNGPYAASESSHIGELLARLGVVDVVPARLGSVPKLNPEFVVRADPQVIVVAAGAVQPIAQRPGWDRIRAVRDGRVCELDREQSDIVVRLGPRLAEAAQVLVGCLQRAGRRSAS
jgi:iron complex transport system substrate-binding protein